jgi:hypothetical protein
LPAKYVYDYMFAARTSAGLRRLDVMLIAVAVIVCPVGLSRIRRQEA